jgi:outer membrane receptor for ferrienterochelin and colicin
MKKCIDSFLDTAYPGVIHTSPLLKFTAMISKIACVLMFIIFCGVTAIAQTPHADSVTTNFDKLLKLSFEDLMNVSVITPTQSLLKSKQAPATVVVITAEQIKIRGYRNLAAILNDLPDFTFNDRSDPQFYGVIGSRGIFRQDYFVIMVDGVRISSPTNEPLPILENYPIYLARQIEVVYGPGSALYGADAMAGVINIITQKADAPLTLMANAVGGTQGYNSLSVAIHKKFKNDLKFSLAGQYSYDAQPDFSKIYKDKVSMVSHQTGVFNSSFGPLTPDHPVSSAYETPTKSYNIYASLDKSGFSLKLLHHYAAVPTSIAYRPDNAVYNKDVFYGHGMTVASASYTTTMGKVKSVSSLVSSLYEVNPKSNFRNLLGGMEHGYKYSLGSMLKAEEQLTFTFSEKINVITGATSELFLSIPKTPELQYPVDKKGAVTGILLNSIAENNPQGIEAKFFPLRYTNIGAYLQGQYSPVEMVSITAGARYDNNSRFGSTINPRVGAVINPVKTTTVKMLYGTAFWAPSPMVSYQTYGSFYTQDSGTSYRSDYWHLPNPDLRPITSQTFELSILQKISKNFNATITAYKTKINNLIHDVPDNGNTNRYNNTYQGWSVSYIEVPFNQGKQTNYGGNIRINSTFHIGKAEFNANSSLSYLDGVESTVDAGSKEIEQAQVVPWQFRAGLDGRVSAFHFSLRLLKTSEQRMKDFENESDEKRKMIPGYALLNASVGYSFRDKVTFFVNIENALNERYRSSVSWSNSDYSGSLQNPIRGMAGVRVDF